MSIAGAAKTVVDSAFAYRFIRLMQKDFSEWKAFQVGVIDQNGNVVKKASTPEEKSAYTPFHGAIRALKKKLSMVPGLTAWSVLSSSLAAIGSRFNLTEDEMTLIEDNMKPLIESMVAGDSGGNPEKIASGVNSGSIVNKGPETLKNKKIKKEVL